MAVGCGRIGYVPSDAASAPDAVIDAEMDAGLDVDRDASIDARSTIDAWSTIDASTDVRTLVDVPDAMGCSDHITWFPSSGTADALFESAIAGPGRSLIAAGALPSSSYTPAVFRFDDAMPTWSRAITAAWEVAIVADEVLAFDNTGVAHLQTATGDLVGYWGAFSRPLGRQEMAVGGGTTLLAVECTADATQWLSVTVCDADELALLVLDASGGLVAFTSVDRTGITLGDVAWTGTEFVVIGKTMRPFRIGSVDVASGATASTAFLLTVGTDGAPRAASRALGSAGSRVQSAEDGSLYALSFDSGRLASAVSPSVAAWEVSAPLFGGLGRDPVRPRVYVAGYLPTSIRVGAIDVVPLPGTSTLAVLGYDAITGALISQHRFAAGTDYAFVSGVVVDAMGRVSVVGHTMNAFSVCGEPPPAGIARGAFILTLETR